MELAVRVIHTLAIREDPGTKVSFTPTPIFFGFISDTQPVQKEQRSVKSAHKQLVGGYYQYTVHSRCSLSVLG